MDGLPGASKRPRLARKQTEDLARAIVEENLHHVTDTDRPFLGAQPILLQKPEIATKSETYRATRVACQSISKAIAKAKGILICFGQDASTSSCCKKLLDYASDSQDVVDIAPIHVAVASDWQHTLPLEAKFQAIPMATHGHRLLIYIGTPGKFVTMCIRSDHGQFDAAYKESRLVVLCKGACMLPIGSQEHNIYGVDEAEVLRSICGDIKAKGEVAWGLGAATKHFFMQKAFGYPTPMPMPSAMESTSTDRLKCLVDYVRFSNQLKLANPDMTVRNYYDTGLTTAVLMATIVKEGISLLTDGDGIAMLRDSSIGHVLSKLNQVVAVEQISKKRGVYNFFVGDGASRLNGGTELVMHLMEADVSSLITVFVFNNKAWAVEDNLIAATEAEHVLHNTQFYDAVAKHDLVHMCETEEEICKFMADLSHRAIKFANGVGKGELRLVVVRGLELNVPPIIGNNALIERSKEMTLMREVLSLFAQGCEFRVPLYGCSAFEYIPYLHAFLQTNEGRKYQYVCGRTDIQAAQMMGFQQPEEKCVLFINDVFGINSLGESLRALLSGFHGRQALVMVWHPSVLKVIDNFHVHRPALVWPSVGATVAQFFVRSESSAAFLDFDGDPQSLDRIKQAIRAATPLVMVNILPEHECNFVHLDARIKVKPL